MADKKCCLDETHKCPFQHEKKADVEVCFKCTQAKYYLSLWDIGQASKMIAMNEFLQKVVLPGETNEKKISKSYT